MVTICILILIFTIIGKPVGRLLERLNGVDWRGQCGNIGTVIRKYAIRAGRAAARPLLQFWFVMQDERTGILDKALIYGAIIYIVCPADLLPRTVLKWIGLIDDVAVAGWLYNKVKDKITDDIDAKVESQLNIWFGYGDTPTKGVVQPDLLGPDCGTER